MLREIDSRLKLATTLVGLMACASMAQAQTTPQAGTPDAEPTPPPVVTTPSASTGSAMMAGTGTAKFNTLLQFWGIEDGTNAYTNYRIRRAELKVSGNVAPGTRFSVMADAAKAIPVTATASAATPPVVTASTTDKVLQDVIIGFSLTDQLELVAGQFKPPQTAESLDSASDLLVPERSITARQYSDKREPGVQLNFKSGLFKAALASTNGKGTNVDDVQTENEKDLHLRLDYTPMEKVDIGAWTTAGNSGYDKKARWGANARAGLGDLIVRLEGVRAKDLDVYTTGYVADLGYKFGDFFQAVLRYDAIADLVSGGQQYTASAATVGLNHLLAKNNAKIQASFSQLKDMNGAQGSYTPVKGKEGGLFVLAIQSAM